MGDRPSIDASLARLLAVIDRLEAVAERRGQSDRTSSVLEDELHRLEDDRSRLAQTLDQAEARSARLEETNREVSRRLVAAMESIRGVLERHGG